MAHPATESRPLSKSFRNVNVVALADVFIDVDVQNQTKQGVVVDMRDNNGGYVNDYVLDVFTRKNYLTMTMRGSQPMPARQALGQRALGLPALLVTNQDSLSDAEDFTEGYRALHVGNAMGEPTAGVTAARSFSTIKTGIITLDTDSIPGIIKSRRSALTSAICAAAPCSSTCAPQLRSR